MGPTREIQDQLRELLTDAVTILCKTRLDFCSQLNIEGLIGITLDEHDVFLVKLDELVKNNFQRKEQNIVEDTTEIHEELSDVPTENVKSQRREKDKGALRVARKRSHSDSEKNSESAADLPVECGSNENEPSPSKKPNIELQEYQDENATAETERVIKQEPVDERDCLENAVIEEYQLDSETHKNLNNFIDNLMTSHAMPGSSHSAASDYAQPGPSLATSFDSISASSATHTQSMDSSQMLSPSNITTIAPKELVCEFEDGTTNVVPSKWIFTQNGQLRCKWTDSKANRNLPSDPNWQTYKIKKIIGKADGLTSDACSNSDAQHDLISSDIQQAILQQLVLMEKQQMEIINGKRNSNSNSNSDHFQFELIENEDIFEAFCAKLSYEEPYREKFVNYLIERYGGRDIGQVVRNVMRNTVSDCVLMHYNRTGTHGKLKLPIVFPECIYRCVKYFQKTNSVEIYKNQETIKLSIQGAVRKQIETFVSNAKTRLKKKVNGPNFV